MGEHSQITRTRKYDIEQKARILCRPQVEGAKVVIGSKRSHKNCNDCNERLTDLLIPLQSIFLTTDNR